MSHGPRIQNANLNIRVERTTIDNLRKAADRQGRTVSDLARSALSAATVARTPAELVERSRECGHDARQALVYACTASDDLSLRACAAKLLAYGECDVPVGPSEEHGSMAYAYLTDLGLHREHGPLVYHERVEGIDWWTFFLD